MNKTDIILRNAIVLTMNEDLTQYEPGAVAVSADKIVAVGPEQDILENYEADEVIDCNRQVLMPGLINAHTHVPMTLLRGLADDLRLDVWLLGYMMPVEREFVSPDFVKLGTKLACAEMIRSGVTCFADMYYFEEAIAEATAESGMRAICSQTVMKFPTPDAQSYEESLSMARDFIIRWKDHPLIVPSVAPHAPYTCTKEILKETSQLAREFDVPLHTHISETASEVENMRSDQGMPVVPYVKKQDLLEAKTLAAHCVHIDGGEMRTLLHYNSGVLHNPSSNVKLASGIANVKEMLEIGLNVGIGTDGTASNNDLDMFEEMRLAAFLSKVDSNDPTSLPASTALLMATRMGAQALHISHITGSLEPGKRADLVLVDINKLHNLPRFRRDPQGIYAQLVYAGKASDVNDVMINGKWVMRSQELLTIDIQSLVDKSMEYAEKIDAFLLKREKSILSKLIAIGGATQEESFEVQIKIPVKDMKAAKEALLSSGIEIIRKRHYREYDAYFSFKDPSQGFLRFREDHFINEKDQIENVRSRLTHIGQAKREEFVQKVLLSRSRYIAPADQTLRFYKEYFNPVEVLEIEKDRLRFLVNFKDTEFFLNLDTMKKPAIGYFLEVKSRTWSKKDAELKSQLALELLEFLSISHQNASYDDYLSMVAQ